MAGLPDGEKNFVNMFIRLDMIYDRDRQTDFRQTDGRTDRQTPHDSIDRAYAWHRAAKMTLIPGSS